jgi:alpha-beta hydrolase superfamily lysophospholipase
VTPPCPAVPRRAPGAGDEGGRLCERPPAMSEASTFTFESGDRRSLHVHRWLPQGEPRAVLQVVHGMAEHGGRYAGLAEVFSAAGFAVYAHDQRGHGRSATDAPLGHMDDEDPFGRAATDLRELSHWLNSEHPNRPRLLLGHSMGSFIAQRLLAEHPDAFIGVALSGSNGRPPPSAYAGRLVARLERARLGPRAPSPLLQRLSFGDFNRHFRPNRTDFDWISRDEDEVDAYVADPFCGFAVSVQTWLSLLDALPALTAPEALARIRKDLPIYVFAGTHDAVGDFGRGVMRLVDALRAAWLSDVTVRLYDGGRHEMLHEINRDEVIAELLAWAERVIG